MPSLQNQIGEVHLYFATDQPLRAVPEQSAGRPSTNSEGQFRRAANLDRARRRSSVPDDLLEQRRQYKTRRTVDPGHSSDGPSWIDLAENRVNTTESRFVVGLNRLLQQNRHIPDSPG